MSVVKPSKIRHTAHLVDETLIIKIPSRTNWLQMPLLAVWLVFWFSALFGVTTGFLTSISDGWPSLFLLFWLTFWVIGGFSVILSLLWQLTGQEIIVIDDKALHVKWQLWGFSWKKSYQLVDVSNLRVVSVVYVGNGRSRQIPTLWNRSGPIAFDYGAKTYRFGDGVEEAEAKQIVKIIQNQVAVLPSDKIVMW